ncbi:hypothetical protein FHX49_002515 [Microbacterium endophyticum]|uniref:Ricin B lectin domain-containing protein n=1 Tax=Microbacterium endophyticum TaxID=1526412 RepID=A0A7W4YP93_9MICO|nr:RICIN domain-containing protein [Microbacterium endophyticum]MBB2976927.1 hypothetical protein [Microbacterium endophyticum]NIK35755.1 hypothetical protein [Microbacterium endophyticum]
MKPTIFRRTLAIATSIGVIIGAAAVGMPAAAYQPGPGDLYTAENPQDCNKRPCVLYPKSAQLPSGRIVATFEDSESAVVGQKMPIHVSDDYGTTWRKLTDVPAPAEASSDPQYAKYTSNWTNPYLYVMPETVGDLAAGTLLLANIVSGDDQYYNEQKAADPNWAPSGDGDRQDLALALYASTDEGQSWSLLNIIAEGGWQGGSAGAKGRTSEANTYDQVDPIWEPFLMVYEGQLVAYYSDEQDYLSYDATTGIPVIDPDDDTATDSQGQVLLHKTWDGTSAGWSAPVIDVPGYTQDMGNGKTQIGGGRPGMTTVAPTTDGKWMMTFEYFGGGDDTKYKIADDPLEFYKVSEANGTNITALPSAGGALARGGSPVLTTFPDGRIVFNASGSGNVWVNESGRSDGTWKAYQTSLPGGYSRNIQYVDGTGRLLVLQAAWAGGSIGPVKYSEVDLGHSDGAYYSIQNRATGQIISTDADKTQDVSLTGNREDIITWTNNPVNDTQRWHVTKKGENVTFLNKAGGRSIGIWQGNASVGQRVVQWVDDGGSDKLWNLVPTSDGYYKIQSVKNTEVYMTNAGGGGAVDLRASIDASSDAAADDGQEWMLVAEAPTAAALTSGRQSTALVAQDTVPSEATLELNAAVDEPAPVASHANVPGHVYAFSGSDAALDLGVVDFDASEKGSVTLPADLEVGVELKIAVQFDSTPIVWDTVTVEAPQPVVVTPTLTSELPANEAGWFVGPVTVALVDDSETATVEYRLGDDADWVAASDDIVVAAQGITTVFYRATEAGEPIEGSAGSLDVKIDGIAPVTSVDTDPESGEASLGSTVTATFDAVDSVSGVATTEYSTDGGATWVPAASEGVSFTELGDHELQYRSVDVAGNVEEARSVVLTVTPGSVPEATPTASVSSSTASQGGSIVVTASGFEPGEAVQIWIHSTPVLLWSGAASSSGAVNQTVVIPSDLEPGTHRIEVRGAESGSVWLSVTVSGSGSGASLANTGFDTATLAWLTMAALLVFGTGGALVVAGARRRRTHP